MAAEHKRLHLLTKEEENVIKRSGSLAKKADEEHSLG
jgi:hypothetical protein